MKLFPALFLFLQLHLFAQQAKDSVYLKNDIYEAVYSEVLEQPKYVKYRIYCTEGSAKRTGMNFYTDSQVHTSDDKDYVNNEYDKGHMAPAADFNCTREMLLKTFSYINCSLQQQDLNRTTWRLLEAYERKLASTHRDVVVEIRCVFSVASKKLSSGATIPDGYYKKITYQGSTEVYFFKNEKPKTTDFTAFRIK